MLPIQKPLLEAELRSVRVRKTHETADVSG